MCSVLLLACTQVSAAAEVLYAFSFMKFGLFIVKEQCFIFAFMPNLAHADALPLVTATLGTATCASAAVAVPRALEDSTVVGCLRLYGT